MRDGTELFVKSVRQGAINQGRLEGRHSRGQGRRSEGATFKGQGQVRNVVKGPEPRTFSL
jgi:hypothetical protein